MRRQDREIKNFDEIVKVMEKCEVCRLALNDEEYPYILPLNFGMALEDGKIVLYFHGALEGKKYELIAADNRAGFEMDCETRLVTTLEDGNCTMEYESVIGRGKIEMLPEEALHIRRHRQARLLLPVLQPPVQLHVHRPLFLEPERDDPFIRHHASPCLFSI